MQVSSYDALDSPDERVSSKESNILQGGAK